MKPSACLPHVLAVCALLASCEASPPAAAPSSGAAPSVAVSGDDVVARFVFDGPASLKAAVRGDALTLERLDAPFRSVGLRFDAGADPKLAARLRRAGVWSDWAPVEVTWQESGAFNGRIALDGPADALALRAAGDLGGELSFLVVELLPEPAPEPVAPTARAMERFGVQEQALAPPSFVNLRSAWGARATPNCGSAHSPQYLTVHHTVTPTVDSMTPQQRLRQIQAYHIDTNGWCDIGYHFLVSADGRIWQGRASHDRSGAHVANHNTNNVGISFMGSFHIDPVPQAMIESVPQLMAWFRDNYGIPLNRTRVLGHREWAGASTACPGGYLLPRLEEMIELASGGPKDQGVTVKASWETIAGQARDLVTGGSSQGVFDAVVGQTLVGHIDVRNGDDRPATDDMILGYWIESPFLVPLDYVIRTDAPARDGATFVDSPANANPANPPATDPPSEGFVHVGVVGPGETVRITFTVRAVQYSIGAADHPDLRGWVKHIANYYGEQDGWNDPVEANSAGGWLRAYAQSDLFSPIEWQFNGGEGADIEGWRILNDVSELAINTVDNALAIKASGPDPHVGSPAWTKIDAAALSKVVLRARQHGGPRDAQLFWAHAGESFAEERSVTFSTAGDAQYAVIELELAGKPGWDGEITQLRLDPWQGGPYDGAAAWFDVDYLMLVAGSTPIVDADGDGATSERDCDDTDPGRFPGAAELCDGVDNNCNGAVDEAPECDGGEDAWTPGSDATTGDVPGPDDVPVAGDTSTTGVDADVRTASACACRVAEPRARMPFGLLPLVGTLLWGWRRTRRRS